MHALSRVVPAAHFLAMYMVIRPLGGHIAHLNICPFLMWVLQCNTPIWDRFMRRWERVDSRQINEEQDQVEERNDERGWRSQITLFFFSLWSQEYVHTYISAYNLCIARPFANSKRGHRLSEFKKWIPCQLFSLRHNQPHIFLNPSFAFSN